MASMSSRRLVSRRSNERPTTKGDDPWCLICGVNLALDGRTFTVVSSHQNSELCDVFVRVLAMTFTHEHAFVNVCNRCERQLKRLGRTTNIAMARQEGRKFRQQVEGNVAKHGLQGVELGDFRNINIPTSAASSKPHSDGTSASSAALRRGESVEVTSGARKGRELYSRSNSSVRFEEDREAGKRGAYNRDLSAPERKMQTRDLHSSFNETDKNRDVKRGTRSSVHSTSVERTASFRPISDDTKSTVDRRSKSSIPSHQRVPLTRDGKRSIQKMNSVDLPKKSGNVTTSRPTIDASKKDMTKSHTESRKAPANQHNNVSKNVQKENNDIHNDSWELSSGELNPFTADIERENFNVDTADVFDDQTREQFKHVFGEFHARDDHMLTDDDHFIKTERAVFMETSQSSESSNETDDNAEKYRGDVGGHAPQIEEHTDANTANNEDDNTRRSELAVDDENKDRAKRLRVTFSENLGTSETSDDPLIHESSESPRPHQDNESDKASTDKGDSQQDSSPLIADTEDNREEHRDGFDFQEETSGKGTPVDAGDDTRPATDESVTDSANGEGKTHQDEEHGLIEADRLQQDNDAIVSETGDLVHLELTTSSSFLRHNQDTQSPSQTPWLYSVSKVIQVTQMERSMQLDDVDFKADEELTFVKDTLDQNSSQVSTQLMQVEDTSATKSEASPLIDKDEGKGGQNSQKAKDSKFKDQQPGLPCCTIL